MFFFKCALGSNLYVRFKNTRAAIYAVYDCDFFTGAQFIYSDFNNYLCTDMMFSIVAYIYKRLQMIFFYAMLSLHLFDLAIINYNLKIKSNKSMRTSVTYNIIYYV